MQYLVPVVVILLIYLVWRAYAVNAPNRLPTEGTLPEIFNRIPSKYYDENGNPTIGGFLNWLADGAPGLHASDMFGGLPTWFWLLLIIILLLYGRSSSKL